MASRISGVKNPPPPGPPRPPRPPAPPPPPPPPPPPHHRRCPVGRQPHHRPRGRRLNPDVASWTTARVPRQSMRTGRRTQARPPREAHATEPWGDPLVSPLDGR